MTGQPFFSPLTCQLDGLVHLVSDEAAHAGRLAQRGTYRAACGVLVRAAPLIVPPGRACLTCEMRRSAFLPTPWPRCTSSARPASRPAAPVARVQTPASGRGAEPLPRRPHPGRFPSQETIDGMSAAVTRDDAIRAYPEPAQLAAIRDAG